MRKEEKTGTHPVYGNVVRRIIRDGDVNSLMWLAKKLSFSAANIVGENGGTPVCLKHDSPDGYVSVYRYGNSEIWDLRERGGDTMLFSHVNDVDLYSLSIYGNSADKKYKAIVRNVYTAADALPCKFNYPYVYTLEVSGSYPTATYTLTARFLKGGEVAATSTIILTGRYSYIISPLPNGVIILTYEYTQGSNYRRVYMPPIIGEWEVTAGTYFSGYTTYISKFSIDPISKTFTKDYEVTLPDTLKTTYLFPATGVEGYASIAQHQFMTQANDRIAIGLSSRMTIGYTGGWSGGLYYQYWPTTVANTIRFPVVYVYNTKTMVLETLLSGMECTELSDSIDFILRERTIENSISDELWGIKTSGTGTPESKFEVIRYNPKTAERTVSYEIGSEWEGFYYAYEKCFFYDSKGLFIPHIAGFALDKLERLNFNDSLSGGIERDETGDITLIEYESSGTPLPTSFRGVDYSLVKRVQFPPAASYPWK